MNMFGSINVTYMKKILLIFFISFTFLTSACGLERNKNLSFEDIKSYTQNNGLYECNNNFLDLPYYNELQIDSTLLTNVAQIATTKCQSSIGSFYKVFLPGVVEDLTYYIFYLESGITSVEVHYNVYTEFKYNANAKVKSHYEAIYLYDEGINLIDSLPMDSSVFQKDKIESEIPILIKKITSYF